MKTTDRDRQLADEFNGFWKQCLGRDEDYYSRLTLDGFVRLKRALGNINNIITLKTTLSFIDCLLAEKVVLLPQAEEMRRRVKETSANANGFDVCYSGGPDGLPLIAEVKCNIPVKKDRFGAAQEAGIRKDIEALLQGKRKMGVTDVSGYYKFMAVLDTAGGSAREAMQRLIGNFFPDGRVKEYIPGVTRVDDTQIVYVVYINVQGTGFRL